MKISTTLITALGFATLAACGSATTENEAANMDANLDSNMVVPDDMGMTTDANMATDGNGAINATDGMNTTENAMANDLTTNDADTNLANGM